MHGPLAGRDAAQERERVDDRPGVAAGMSTRFERCAPTATKTASNPPSARSAARSSTRWSQTIAHAERRDAADLGVEHVARQAVGGDAVAHHAAGLGAGVADLDLVAEPREVVRGREPARAGADHEHALAAALGRRRRTASRARSPGRRGSARPSGSRRRCRARRGCRRSRTGGSRRARGSRASGCRRRAGARPPRAGPSFASASQAWMFSPAGQPALHGGSRST